jgi:hypothetical protein
MRNRFRIPLNSPAPAGGHRDTNGLAPWQTKLLASIDGEMITLRQDIGRANLIVRFGAVSLAVMVMFLLGMLWFVPHGPLWVACNILIGVVILAELYLVSYSWANGRRWARTYAEIQGCQQSVRDGQVPSAEVLHTIWKSNRRPPAATDI